MYIPVWVFVAIPVAILILGFIGVVREVNDDQRRRQRWLDTHP